MAVETSLRRRSVLRVGYVVPEAGCREDWSGGDAGGGSGGRSAMQLIARGGKIREFDLPWPLAFYF